MVLTSTLPPPASSADPAPLAAPLAAPLSALETEPIPEPDALPLGVYRLRIATITAMMLVVALASGEIFDQRIWWLLVGPALVGATSLALVQQRWPIRVMTSVVAIVASTAGVSLAVGGSGADIVDAFVGGPQRLLTTDWPSPNLTDLIGTVSLVLAVATSAAVLMARRSTLHLSPIVPVAVTHIIATALGAPLGVRLRWLLPLAVLAVVFAVLRPGSDMELGERLTSLRGERRLFPVALLAIGLAAGLAIPLSFSDRADPRRNEPAERSAALLDPIEATLALRAINPPIDLHDVAVDFDSTGAPLTPERWRTTALAEYDGERWAPDLTLRPIGRRLGANSDDTVGAVITFLEPGAQLVPLPGAPVVVDEAIETDGERSIVRLTERPVAGERVDIVTRIDPAANEVAGGDVAVREVDENAAALSELAVALVEQGGADATSDVFSQLRAMESALSDDFTLRSDASGGGLQRALVERFLRDTQRGNAEQFTTSFVLLARSLGVDARVATGFIVEPDRYTVTDDSTTATLRSGDAATWAEVRIGDEWVAFDPVPESEASDATPPLPEPQEQTPAAAQPPIQPPPDTADEPVVTQTEDDSAEGAGFPTFVTWTLRGLAVAGSLLVPLLALVFIVLGVKAQRRRSRLSGAAADRVRGAWSVATNRLVDAGMTIEVADTNADIVLDAEPYLDGAHRELARLATLANTTTFGTPPQPELLADDAAFCLSEVEHSMTESRSTFERIRWALSLRSLRRSTKSPV